ncbi:Amino acid transporter [Fictibacillus enclensis]|uniref:Putrescine importer PuuP n=1 Tax=Fictibacillus enclensis TaxID=1017270 RepID=A0A0V8J580_9BACL|nr:APC family permease [Fictibacillus enclensis]KSU82163.1 Putrescine importer PuuP [Fictibacillus enclensis]SCC28523.1 Amino acid transporter [Fictibacillus enclensis]
MNGKPTLAKSLKLHQVVFMGLAWMTPMIFFTVYGVAYQAAHGLLAAAYVTAFVAIFFTAYSYSRMVKAYPISGSAYTYTKKSIHPHAGFLVGWALLMDYIFSPIIAILTFGIFMHTEFPSIPTAVWIILMNVVLVLVNIIGIKSVARISGISVMVQIGFILVFCVLIGKDLLTGGTGSPAVFSLAPFFGPEVSFGAVFSGAALICFCFLGFDAVTTMSEETIDARKTVPKAIFLIVLIAASMYIAISYLSEIAYPHFTFANPDNAAYHLVKLVGGNLLSAFFITVLIVATFTQGISSVTSVSRFLYALGQESILPKTWFTSLHPKYQTPVTTILVVGVISMAALFINLDSAVMFVSFGALTAFTFVNLSVIFHYYIKLKKRSPKETFLYLIFPLTGAGFIGWLLTLLNPFTLGVGIAWVILGFIYLFAKNEWSKAKKGQPESSKNEGAFAARKSM